MILFLTKLKSQFHSDSTRGKVVRNVFWAVVGKVVTLLSTLFVGILVARYLGPEQYGLMNYIISIVGLFTVFSTLENYQRKMSLRKLSSELPF